ncbi:hypothetical protein AOQ84DRAFT_351787 [Glonium stellatum]|uniref:DUF7053 domain-containing protein n=1 Tax=Glonium stellatum TaxID=574774 RepID=A0A8E2FB18_9PEZI|nr:hypothetical protein AOQ84DRAFT_351787 [Glonium stellatum]
MSRKSHSFRVAHPLPPSLSPGTAIAALHLHSKTLTLHPLVVSFKEIPTDTVAV